MDRSVFKHEGEHYGMTACLDLKKKQQQKIKLEARPLPEGHQHKQLILHLLNQMPLLISRRSQIEATQTCVMSSRGV